MKNSLLYEIQIDICIKYEHQRNQKENNPSWAKSIEELIKVAKEKIVDSDDDVSADRLKNAAATKKLAIMDAFEILNLKSTKKKIC